MQPCGLTNPARQSLASSRKRVLRGGGRHPLRSVDSESRCRAIEPRNLCSREPPLLTQAGAAPRRHNGLASFGPTGVQEQGAGTRGSLGNLRDPAVSTDISGSGTGIPTPRAPGCASRPVGANRTQGWYRQVKATKRGERDGRESERPIVTLRRGNSTEGPRGVSAAKLTA